MAKFGIVVPFVDEHNDLVNLAVASIPPEFNVHVIYDKYREGVPAMLNSVLMNFEDEYFGYFGADDLMMPSAYENVKNFNGDWCYGDCIQRENGLERTYYAGLFNKDRLKDENYIPAGSVFVRTEIIKEIKFNEDLTFAEDWEMWLQLVKRNLDPWYINQVQYRYSMDTSTFNKTKLKRWINKRKFRWI